CWNVFMLVPGRGNVGVRSLEHDQNLIIRLKRAPLWIAVCHVSGYKGIFTFFGPLQRQVGGNGPSFSSGDQCPKGVLLDKFPNFFKIADFKLFWNKHDGPPFRSCYWSDFVMIKSICSSSPIKNEW